ncbi:E3 ubiquitin-protein ligase TRIM56-like isoform X2 [Haliotis asinina]|uniref:E3 ubiquitin-protein ligase TRIM56-like isoform X2 n=1 Tax=Haliotis asinina TaxID=109174 RepID=UPI003531E093
MSGRGTSSRLKALTRSSLKSKEKFAERSPAKPTPYSRPRRQFSSKDPKGKASKKPTDTKDQKTSNSSEGKGKPFVKAVPDGPPIQPIIPPGRSELIEIIENTPGCRSGSELMLGILVMKLEGATAILTSDKVNKSVNALYRESGEERTSTLSTSASLTNFTIIEDNLVAAGVWYQDQIIFFKVFPDLDLQRTIDTKTRYSSIAFMSPCTLVGSRVRGNCGVDVLDMSGNILRKFDSSHFSNPYSVCTYNGKCIVGDMTNHAIMCFNDMGNLLFKFKPRADRKFVGFLTVTSHGGYIYASDREGHRVVQLTSDGEFVRDVLTKEDGIEEPQGICVTDDNLLYVSVINSYIRVYRIE